MNSLGDSPVHTAEPSDLVIKTESIYTCNINIQVPREVKNQRALAKGTSEIIKNGQDLIIQIQIWSG